MGARRRNRSVGRGPSGDEGGFTLLETLIILVILSILVGIAVMVAQVSRTKAWDVTAKSNDRMAAGCMNELWIDLTARGQTYYYDPAVSYSATNWTQYMSYVQPKTCWVRVLRQADNRLRLNGKYKGGALVTAGSSYDWNLIYGNIGCLSGYRDRSGNRWVAPAESSTREYVTVIVLTQGSHRAFFSSYRLGKPFCSGSFDWNSINGNTTNFAYDQ